MLLVFLRYLIPSLFDSLTPDLTVMPCSTLEKDITHPFSIFQLLRLVHFLILCIGVCRHLIWLWFSDSPQVWFSSVCL